MKDRYQTQHVRDLWWALRSPMLMEHSCIANSAIGQSETDRYQGLLKKLDQPRSALEESVRRGAGDGLGNYFECLVQTWIDEVPPAAPIAANWQVYSGGQTIGEFDLLFRRDARIWHWELAVKFYLGHPAPDGQFRWYGPNPVDRLDRKWAKMRGQQLRLCRHPASAGALDVLGIESEPISRAFIKGYLFLPLDEKLEVEYPPDINPQGLRGWWVHHGQLADERHLLDPGGQLQWLALPQSRWLSRTFVGPADRLCNFDELRSELHCGTPTLVAGLRSTAQGPQEVTRGFIVPDGWPEL